MLLQLIARAHRAMTSINDVLLGWYRRLAIGLIAVMTLIVIAGVFFRYVLGNALPWTEEISKFLMVWMTFIAAPIAYRQGALVAVGALPDALQGRAQQALVLLVQAVVIATMVVFLKEGSFLTWNARIQTASTIELSISYVYVSMPLGAVALTTVALEMLLGSLKELIRPSSPGDRPADSAEVTAGL